MPYVYVGNQPTGYVDPDGRIGLPGFLKDGIGVLGRGVNAFGRALTRSNQPGFYASISGSPSVTDNFPPFLGNSITDDDDGGIEVWLGISISLQELERRRREKLAAIQQRWWGATVALSGSGRYGPLPANNPVYQFYSVGGAAYGSGSVIAGALESGRFVSDALGRVRPNTGIRVPVSSLRPGLRAPTMANIRFFRGVGGVGLFISGALLGVDLYDAYLAGSRYRAALAVARFTGGLVGGAVGGFFGSFFTPVVGTAAGAVAGSYAGSLLAERLLNRFFLPSERY